MQTHLGGVILKLFINSIHSLGLTLSVKRYLMEGKRSMAGRFSPPCLFSEIPWVSPSTSIQPTKPVVRICCVPGTVLGPGDTTENKIWSLLLGFHFDCIAESSIHTVMYGLFKRSVVSREISGKSLDDLRGICTMIKFQVKSNFCITTTSPLDHQRAS